MEKTFTCPHCNKEVEITEALTHQIQDDVRQALESQHKLELEQTAIKIRQKIQKEQELKEKQREEEAKDLRELTSSLKEQLIEANQEKRELKKQQEQADIERDKAIAQAEERARLEALKKASEEFRLKDLDHEKKLNDALKANDELKRKLEQGSMQTQGEVLELDLENLLKNTFPQDTIEPVGKGISGADLKQTVKSPRGNVCGIILWEFKRTKSWSDEWIGKLKIDVRNEKANVGALVSQAFPLSVTSNIEFYNGIWITSYANILPLAILLRKNILDIAREKFISQNSTEKSQQLYSYITGHQFRQQVEALAEIFGEMNGQIIKERMAFEKSWKQREGQINRLFLSTANIIGGIEGTGVTIPQIKGLELLDDGQDPIPDNSNSEPPTLL